MPKEDKFNEIEETVSKSSKELIDDLVAHISSQKDEILVALDSENADDIVFEKVELTFDAIEHGLKNILSQEKELDEEDLDEMAAVAAAFDESGDPLLQKQASVLDQILLTFGSRAAFAALKKAEENEISRLKEKYKDPYKFPKEELDKQNHVKEGVTAIQKQIKEYRPQEAALSTRSCPDHPGALMSRVGEDTYQCSMDKYIYNYTTGFTTQKGNKIPGTSVANQGHNINDVNQGVSNFDTRESVLNK